MRLRRALVLLCALCALGAALPAAGLAAPRVRPPVAQYLPALDGGSALVVRPGHGAPGYRLEISGPAFGVRTLRDSRVVLDTPVPTETVAPLVFQVGEATHRSLSVITSDWDGRSLTLAVNTTSPEHTIEYRITPRADRYLVRWSVTGVGAKELGTVYDVLSAGSWYGHGEDRTIGQRQPSPLDDQVGLEDLLTPFGNHVRSPFFVTSSSAGLFFDTLGDVVATIDRRQDGLSSFTVSKVGSVNFRVFVERTPSDVYYDYIDTVGKPEKSDATYEQYEKPVWNTWAQFYTTETQNSVIQYAEGLKSRGLDGHALQIDGGWERQRGDLDFERARFPTPEAIAPRLNRLGFDLGLWVSFYVNTASRNFRGAAEKGYLLKSAADPASPCIIEYLAGRARVQAGIVDLANPDARAWYQKKLSRLAKRYGVDGFKFDTRFFDRTCAASGGKTPFDYLDLAGELADRYDHQGVGIRFAYAAQAKRGFVTRQVDKGTSFEALQLAVRQNLALSTVGYPFVATDMIGGSLQQTPPTKDVLVRWAQTASLMPIMYASTSPAGVTNAVTGETAAYDAETSTLYRAAIERHKRLAPYIFGEVKDSVATGEPLVKPLFFDYPKQRASYTTSDQWLLGDALLAAPILSEEPSRSVFLPPGTWYDPAYGRVVPGPLTLDAYAADLATAPAFVRLGLPESSAAAGALDDLTVQIDGEPKLARRGTLTLPLKCPPKLREGCSGTLELGVVSDFGTLDRRGLAPVLATASYSLAPGTLGSAKVRIGPSALAKIKRLKSLDAYALTVEGVAPLPVRTSVDEVTIVAPKPPKPPRDRDAQQ